MVGSEVDADVSRELYCRARSLVEDNRLAEAVAVFEESLKIDPHFKTLELLGETLVRLGRLKEALIPLAASVTLNKQSRAASFLAEAFFNLGDLDKAEEIAKLALSREPNNKKALKVLASIG